MKKGFSIVFTSTDSSVSRQIFLSKKLFFILTIILILVIIFVVFGLLSLGMFSYKTIQVEMLKRRINEMEKDFSKLENIKKKLEIAEAENLKIKMMLGIDKAPPEVNPAIDKVNSDYEKKQMSIEPAENLPSLLPVVGEISRNFSEEHTGIDISAPLYSPVIAAAGGKVVSAGWDTTYGNYVVIEHSPNYKTFYGHLYSLNVKLGENVKGGEIIGTVGSTGRSTSPHLHYEVIFNGKPVDPMAYLPTRFDKKGGL
jgi:murein DD-endopeptidase MepM/ murein hydrolase activator NlpD